MSHDRIHNAQLRSRIVSAEQAAALIQPGETVAMSGFTGSGYPKAVPKALAEQLYVAAMAQGLENMGTQALFTALKHVNGMK